MYLFDRFADLVRARRDGEPLDAATATATTPAADPTTDAGASAAQNESSN
jgi:carbamoyl-phosphate synthase small subunit